MSLFGLFLPIVCAPTTPTDLIFVYDAKAIGSWKAQAVSQFIAKSVREFDFVSADLRVGRETENCPSGNVPLGSALQASDLSLVRFTTFSDMLRKVTRSSFSVENGGRQNSLKMAVVVVDANQRISFDVLKEMKGLKNTVDFFYIVAAGDNRQMLQLKTLTGSGNFISVKNYDELNASADKLMSDLCDFFSKTSF